MNMKKILTVLISAALATSVLAAEQATSSAPANSKANMSLANARSNIDKVIANPSEMKSVMQQLSAEDQVQFLADVNKAIAEMPASPEEVSAKYINVDKAALEGAAKGNVSALIAETFATVPPEHLSVLSEQFSKDVFDRNNVGGAKYSDADFAKVATNLLKKIATRTAETDNGSPRAALAIVMLAEASHGAPADLVDQLIEQLADDDAKDLARDEWIPQALGKNGDEKSVESILAAADAGRRPDFAFALVVAGPQYPLAILQDIYGKNTDSKSFINARSPLLDAVNNPLQYMTPTLGATVGGDVAGGAGDRPLGGDVPQSVRPGSGNRPQPEPEPEPQPQPRPYQWQRMN